MPIFAAKSVLILGSESVPILSFKNEAVWARNSVPFWVPAGTPSQQNIAVRDSVFMFYCRKAFASWQWLNYLAGQVPHGKKPLIIEWGHIMCTYIVT